MLNKHDGHLMAGVASYLFENFKRWERQYVALNDFTVKFRFFE